MDHEIPEDAAALRHCRRLILLLLVPLTMIRSVINERSAYRDEAFSRVADSRAGAQQLVGPVRVVPWVERKQVELVDPLGVKKTEVQVTEGHWLQMPASLEVGGEMLPSQRGGAVQGAGVQLERPDEGDLRRRRLPGEGGPQLRPAVCGGGVSDVRGLVGTPNLRVDGKQLRLLPGVGAAGEIGRGLHAPVAGFDADQGGTLAPAPLNWSCAWMAVACCRWCRWAMTPTSRCVRAGRIRRSAGFPAQRAPR